METDRMEDYRRQLRVASSPFRQSALARLLNETVDLTPLLQDITDCLQDPEENIRLLAVSVLPKAGPQAVAPLITAARESQSPAVRVAAAAALGRLKSAAALAVETLIACLETQEEDLRVNAAFSLSRIGPAAVPRLAACLAAKNEKMQLGSIDALTWMGPEAQNAVADLKAAAPGLALPLQLAACAALVKITGHASDGLHQLMDHLGHPQADVRLTCVERLGEIGMPAEPAIAAILLRLRDSAGPVRAAAALALVRIKTRCTEAVEALAETLNDPDPQARINAAIALATIGPPAKPALPALRNGLADPDERAMRTAAAAIERIEGSTGLCCRIDGLGALYNDSPTGRSGLRH